MTGAPISFEKLAAAAAGPRPDTEWRTPMSIDKPAVALRLHSHALRPRHPGPGPAPAPGHRQAVARIQWCVAQRQHRA